MLVKSHRLSVNFPLPSSMCIGNSEVLFVSSEKNLGVTLDCNLKMTPHVLNICRSAYTELRQIGSICHLLTAQVTQTLVCAFILSHLDYCNCVLAGCPQFLIDRFWDCRKLRTQMRDLSVGQKKPWPCSAHSSLVTLATNQGTNTVQNFHALFQCNHRHCITIPLRTSPSVHSL